MALFVYGASSKILRRVIIGAAEQLALHQGGLVSGEAAVHVADASIIGPPFRQELATALGVSVAAIPTGRCCVIKGGVVVDVISADPVLDAPHDPSATHVLSDTANKGWTYAAGTFTAPAHSV